MKLIDHRVSMADLQNVVTLKEIKSVLYLSSMGFPTNRQPECRNRKSTHSFGLIISSDKHFIARYFTVKVAPKNQTAIVITTGGRSLKIKKDQFLL
jgi:hypothetical protein